MKAVAYVLCALCMVCAGRVDGGFAKTATGEHTTSAKSLVEWDRGLRRILDSDRKK